MDENIKFKKDIINIVLISIIIFGLFIFALLKPEKERSESERRGLATMPEFKLSTILVTPGNSTAMDKFENYAADQFPLRELFRTVQSGTDRYILGKYENNNLVMIDKHITKVANSIDKESIDFRIEKIEYIIDNYINDENVYMALIPDKNYYLKDMSCMTTFDYDEYFNIYMDATKEYAEFIDLRDKLSINNFYYTDTHWKQETLIGVTDYLLLTMTGRSWSETVKGNTLCENLLRDDFEGVYYGQLALPVSKDKLIYLNGQYIDGLEAYCYDTGEEQRIDVYDEEFGYGSDGYELYLTGTRALVTVINPNAETDKELVLLRDSYGSSIAPLLAAGYSKITLVDLRYINPAMVGRFVDFEGVDVLFLYSTLL